MLSPGAEAAWMIAAGEAASGGHPRIEPAHLLIGALSLGKLEKDGDPAGLGVSAALVSREHARVVRALSTAGLDATRLRRRARAQLGRGPVEGPPTGPLSRSLTCKAVFAAAEDLAGPDRPLGVAHLLAALADDVDTVTARLIRQGSGDLAGLKAALLEAGKGTEMAEEGTAEPILPPEAFPTPTLDRFGRDLTALARRGELGPVVGRRGEILAVRESLIRAGRSHPVLVGEVDVGKTAIVEAIAIRAAEGRDAGLRGRRVVELHLGPLLGAEPRDKALERLEAAVAEARRHPGVVVFVGDLEALLEASGEGRARADVSTPIKLALASGELRCIGATTGDGYRRFVEWDPSLASHFESVPVDEPDRDATLEILRGLRSVRERQHGVSLPDETLAAAVDLSVRFEPDRRLPGKAIELVDQAAARTRLPPPSLVRPPASRTGGRIFEAPPVTPVIVARVLAEKRRLPLDLVTEGLDTGVGSRLLALEGFLRERVLGQDEAIARIARRLRSAFAAPRRRPGPIAALLFLGPSGVGKTEIARLLAEHLFGSASGMIRIDMSELMDEAAARRSGLLEAIRAKPSALLLLDEIEKAHPRVLDLLLPLFTEGRLTDTKGESADASRLVVVMTANPGPADPHAYFRRDLLTSVDEVVSFRPLDPDDVEMIVGRALAELMSAVDRRHGVRVRVTPEAARFAAQQAALAAPGARGARRTVERLVNGPLSALVLTGKLTRHTAWVAVYDEGGIYLLPEG